MCKLCESKPHGICKCGCGKSVGKGGCIHHSRRTKLLCGAQARRGKHHCRTHGGNNRVGVASPNFKTGLWTRHIPSRYVERLQESLDSADQINLNRQIAMLDAREVELLQQFSNNSSSELFDEILEAWSELHSSIDAESISNAARVALRAMEVACTSLSSDREIWSDLSELYDRRAKYSSEQSKINMTEERSMPAAQVMTLLGIVLGAARQYIQDPKDLEAFGMTIEAHTPGGVAARSELDALEHAKKHGPA